MAARRHCKRARWPLAPGSAALCCSLREGERGLTGNNARQGAPWRVHCRPASPLAHDVGKLHTCHTCIDRRRAGHNNLQLYSFFLRNFDRSARTRCGMPLPSVRHLCAICVPSMWHSCGIYAIYAIMALTFLPPFLRPFLPLHPQARRARHGQPTGRAAARHGVGNATPAVARAVGFCFSRK